MQKVLIFNTHLMIFIHTYIGIASYQYYDRVILDKSLYTGSKRMRIPVINDKSTAKKKILLVEDDDGVAEALSYNLQWNGYHVDAIADGAIALKSVQQEPPDLLILDIALPTMNGLDMCRELRKA